MPSAVLRENWYSPNDNGEVSWGMEADSQTFDLGDLLTVSSGKLQALASANTNVDSTGAKIAGRALRDGQNSVAPDQVTGEEEKMGCPFLRADDQFAVWLPFYHASGSGSAEYTDADVGHQCVVRNEAGTYVANIGVTSNPNLVLIAKEPRVANGETYYWGLWKVLAAGRLF